VGLWCLQYANGFWQLTAVAGSAALVNGCVNPIIDSAAMHTLTTNAVPLSDYGRFRVFGGIGWGITAAAIGPMLDRWGVLVLFYSFAALSGLFLAVLLAFPLRTDGSKPEAAASGAPATKRSSHRLGFRGFIRHLLGQPGVLLFLVLLTIMGVCKAVIDVFLFLHLQQDLHASHLLLGVSLAVTTIGEIPFFFYSGPILRRFGTLTIVCGALIAYACRLVGYGFIRNPWWVLPLELLHGLTFALSWSSVASFAAKIAPPGYGSTTMGVISAFFWGLGFSLGGIGGGLVHQSFGAERLFQGSAALAALAGVAGGVNYYLCVHQRIQERIGYIQLPEEEVTKVKAPTSVIE